MSGMPGNSAGGGAEEGPGPDGAKDAGRDGTKRSSGAGAEGGPVDGPLVVKAYGDLAAGSETQGKFVVLTKGKGLHLVLSPVSFTPYHANIVYQYLQVEGRGEVLNAGEAGCKILSASWKVHGGGYFAVENWLHHMRLHGKSTAFGKYRAALLAPHADAIPEALGLAGYTLQLE
jgi:hypothetical protein